MVLRAPAATRGGKAASLRCSLSQRREPWAGTPGTPFPSGGLGLPICRMGDRGCADFQAPVPALMSYDSDGIRGDVNMHVEYGHTVWLINCKNVPRSSVSSVIRHLQKDLAASPFTRWPLRSCRSVWLPGDLL